jgi:hypothetical protein
MFPHQFRAPSAGLAAVCLLLSAAVPYSTAALIFADNFNAPDTNNLDGSDQTGRRSGLLAADVAIRSSYIQHGIVNNQLDFLRRIDGPGRIRFQSALSLSNIWWNFASGLSGAEILSQGGLRIDFDWFPSDNTADDWVSFNLGFLGIAAGEPSFRVNDPQTDFGILFRNNGGTQYFDNGAATTGLNFDVSGLLQHHVTLTYSLSSFADGANVSVSALVDGMSVLDGQLFQWENNSGELYMELGTLAAGTRIDNFAISSVPEPSGAALIGAASLGLASLRRRRRT